MKIMTIKIDIQEESYRLPWAPYSIDFTDLKRDVDKALNKTWAAMRQDSVTAVSVKIEHDDEEVGTISARLDE